MLKVLYEEEDKEVEIRHSLVNKEENIENEGECRDINNFNNRVNNYAEHLNNRE